MEWLEILAILSTPFVLGWWPCAACGVDCLADGESVCHKNSPPFNIDVVVPLGFTNVNCNSCSSASGTFTLNNFGQSGTLPDRCQQIDTTQGQDPNIQWSYSETNICQYDCDGDGYTEGVDLQIEADLECGSPFQSDEVDGACYLYATISFCVRGNCRHVHAYRKQLSGPTDLSVDSHTLEYYNEDCAPVFFLDDGCFCDTPPSTITVQPT